MMMFGALTRTRLQYHIIGPSISVIEASRHNSNCLFFNSRWFLLLTEFTLRSCEVQVHNVHDECCLAILVERPGMTSSVIIDDVHELLILIGKLVEVDRHHDASDCESTLVYWAVEDLCYRLMDDA